MDRLLTLAWDQLAAQLAAYSTLDTKAGTLIAADAVFTGLLFGLRTPLPVWLWLAALAALGASVTVGFVAMRVVEPNVGPEPGSFYEVHGQLPADEMDRQLLSYLSLALRENEGQLDRKGAWWTVGAGLLVLSVVAILVGRAVR